VDVERLYHSMIGTELVDVALPTLPAQVSCSWSPTRTIEVFATGLAMYVS